MFNSDYKTHSQLWIFLLILSLLIACEFFNLSALNEGLRQRQQGVEGEVSPKPSKSYGKTTTLDFTQHHQCLHDKDINNLISQAEQVIIAMPAKAAGTTMKDFTKDCMGRVLPDNFLNDANKVKNTLLMGEPLSMPPIITSHMYDDKPLRKLIEQLPSSALLIYIHREEKDRLLSAIKHVYSYDGIRKKFCDIAYDSKNNTCIVGETSLIQSIEERTWEIGCGESRLLTCDTYDAIHKNAPNMMFVHYKQADKLQRILAKYHCPNLLEEDTIKSNVETQKVMETKVRFAQKSVKEVDLKEWTEAKASMLQFALGLKESQGCQSLTREVEKDLFACETEFVLI